jgi:serine/threonine-protein kinase
VVEGYDLRELIDATDRVGDERALSLLGQVGDALDTARGLGLVHRDVKPANILIGAGQAEHASFATLVSPATPPRAADIGTLCIKKH